MIVNNNKLVSKWDETFLMIAKFIGDRHSTCARVKVGCVITKNGRIVSIGYNGVPPKKEHCKDKFSDMITKIDKHGNAYNNLYQTIQKIHLNTNVLELNNLDKVVEIYDRPFNDANKKIIYKYVLSNSFIEHIKKNSVANNYHNFLQDEVNIFLASDEFINIHRQWSADNELHAEQNAIGFAARNGINIENASLYCNITPCKFCAKLIVSSGIKNIYYSKVYDREDTRDYLAENNIKTIEIKL